MSRASGHPDLIAFVAGHLPPGEAAGVRAHLALCPECGAEAGALSSLRASLRAIGGAGHPGVVDLAAFVAGDLANDPPRYASIEEHLSGCSDCQADRAMLERQPSPSRRVAPRWIAAVAAAALVCAAVGVFAVRRRDAPPHAMPPLEVPIILAAPQRGAAVARTLPAGRSLSFTVLLPFGAPAGRYRVRVESDDGVPADAGLPVTPIPSDGSRLSLSLRVPATPGRYRLVVVPEPVPSEHLRVEPPAIYPFFVSPPERTPPTAAR